MMVVHAHPDEAWSAGGILAAYSVRGIPAGPCLGEITGGAAP